MITAAVVMRTPHITSRVPQATRSAAKPIQLPDAGTATVGTPVAVVVAAGAEAAGLAAAR